jgi:hypothetical protein
MGKLRAVVTLVTTILLITFSLLGWGWEISLVGPLSI